MRKHWTAEQTAHPDAKADRWALIYDPTPGGRDNGDGTRSYSLRFPALLISDLVESPQKVAEEIADMLNLAEEANKKGDTAFDEMLAALENLENDDGNAMPPSAWNMVQKAIARAKGVAV